MATTKRTMAAAGVAAAAFIAVAGQQAGAAAPQDGPSGATLQGAMQRDLGLSAAQVTDRLAAEKSAAAADKALKADLGSSFAGSYFDATSGKLVVAVTDAAAAKAAQAQGAQAVTVARSAAQLDSVVSKLDAASAPSTVAGWYVDVASNQVVVPTRDVAAAEAFVAKAGVPASAVEVQQAPEDPQPLAQGGDAYYIGGARCSIGFAVSGGFVTAGHCGSTGDATQTPSGTFAGSSFPGNDYAFVRTNEVIAGTVKNGSSSVAVRGSSDAPVGSSICRSGSTTGWRCGTIQARNSTVNYAEGSVTGLIRTNACAEPGDSGGSAISGNQAQGVTSGGSGNCTFGGTTYFQPVNEILGAYGLSLTTS